MYQSWLDGPYKNVGYEKISIGQLLHEWDWMKNAYAMSAPDINSYNLDAIKYNNATSYQYNQTQDFFRSILEDPVEVPKRPCKPQIFYNPYYLNLSFSGLSAFTAMMNQTQTVPIKASVSDAVEDPTPALSRRTGFL